MASKYMRRWQTRPVNPAGERRNGGEKLGRKNWFQQTSPTCLWNIEEVYTVELYARVRRADVVDKMSERAAARVLKNPGWCTT